MLLILGISHFTKLNMIHFIGIKLKRIDTEITNIKVISFRSIVKFLIITASAELQSVYEANKEKWRRMLYERVLSEDEE